MPTSCVLGQLAVPVRCTHHAVRGNSRMFAAEHRVAVKVILSPANAPVPFDSHPPVAYNFQPLPELRWIAAGSRRLVG